MSEVSNLHTTAMEIAERAFTAVRSGDLSTAEALLRQAYENERKAALALVPTPEIEPTRSVLLRSAASLAIDCHEYREAERLISYALSGDPPPEIADELRDLLENVQFGRHLEPKDVLISEGAFQLSLAGPAVGHGIVVAKEFGPRLATVETLLHRTTERQWKMPFRERGGSSHAAREDFEFYVAAPKAASFAVAVRIGTKRPQTMLPGFSGPDAVLDEFLGCLKLFEEQDRAKLWDRIADEAYYRNFTALATRLAPDGDRIRQVGFTLLRGTEQRRIALTRRPAKAHFQRVESENGQAPVTVLGTLKKADETTRNEIIAVVDQSGKKHTILVPTGMMSDIVKPLWGERVAVIAVKRKDGKLSLSEIEPAPAEEKNTLDRASSEHESASLAE